MWGFHNRKVSDPDRRTEEYICIKEISVLVYMYHRMSLLGMSVLERSVLRDVHISEMSIFVRCLD